MRVREGNGSSLSMKQFHRLLPIAFALMLSACQQAPSRVAATDHGDAPATAQAAFAQLGRLRTEADALKTPLAAYTLYRDRYATAEGALRPMLAQVLAATESELGAYDAAVRQFPMGVTGLNGTFPPAALPDPDTYRAIDATDGIVELARSRRIVLINEAHHAAQTRLLTLALLPRLRDLGFTHFAAEGIDEHDVELGSRGYPTNASGIYVREPLYGEIIRTALRLGFVVVPYETANTNADADTREQEQAANLMARVLRAQPAARLFVHAGYAHVHKHQGYLFGADPMALHLQRMAGTDVLSIDQTMFRPDLPGREYADYRTLLQQFAILKPSVFMRNSDAATWSLEPKFYDVSVILPPADHLVVGRPDWLTLGGAREAVAIDLDVQPEHLPCVLEARYASESDKAIPADRVLIEQRTGQAVLFLRPGSYRISASDANARTLFTRSLRVENAAAKAR